MANHPTLLVSYRVADRPEAAVPGSAQLPCERCGQSVWVSPATRQSFLAGIAPITLVCVRCVSGQEAASMRRKVSVSPAQLVGAADALRLRRAAQE